MFCMCGGRLMDDDSAHGPLYVVWPYGAKNAAVGNSSVLQWHPYAITFKICGNSLKKEKKIPGLKFSSFHSNKVQYCSSAEILMTDP